MVSLVGGPHTHVMRDMRLYTLLLVAASVLHARAASIPDIASIARPDTETESKPTSGVKLIPEQNEEPVDNKTSEEELIKPANTIKDVGNDLRSQKVDEIPVKVVTEKNPEDIANEIPKDEVCKDKIPEGDKPEEDQKEKPSKPSISDISEFEDDVEEPGSDSEEPSLTLLIIRDALQTAHRSIQLTVDSFSATFHTWIKDQSSLLPSEEQISHVKSVIDDNISKLNHTIQGYFNPAQAAKLAEQADDSVNHIEVVENDLKNLEKNFENDVKSVLGSAKADNSTSSGSTNSSGNAPPFYQNIQQLIQQGFTNITTSMQSLFNQNSGDNSTNNLWVQFSQNLGNFFNPQGSSSSGGAQSDDPATPRPSIFQSFQNIFRPPFQAQQTVQGSNQQPQSDESQQQPNRPIIQAIQNNPIVQGISGVFNRQPSKPSQPQASALASPTTEPSKTDEEGSNVVPEKPASSDTEPAQEPATVQPFASGPIQQAIQKNPLVQGIAGAVQKIQSAVNNPEKPRKISHLIHGLHGGHGGHGGDHHHEGSTDKVAAGRDNVAPSADNASTDNKFATGHASSEDNTNKHQQSEKVEPNQAENNKEESKEKEELIPIAQAAEKTE